jgi:hypothetical protein
MFCAAQKTAEIIERLEKAVVADHTKREQAPLKGATLF